MACGGLISQKIWKKKFNFILLHLTFPYYYCCIDIRRHSKLSGLRPDTDSLVCMWIPQTTPEATKFAADLVKLPVFAAILSNTAI